MRILNRLGGIELSQAYATIKAISKKKTEVIAQGRDQFIKGAVERGLDRDRAAKIFDLIEYFGGYGFNKSHSTAYAHCRLSDGLPQGPLPDRVHGGGALLRDGRLGARQVLRRAHRGLPADGDRGAAAEHQRGAARLPGGRGGTDPLRTRGDQGGRVQGGRGDRQGARGAGPVPQPRRLLRADLDQGGRCGLRRDADPRRCLRLPGRTAGQLLAILPEALQAGQAKQEDRRRGQLGLFDVFDSPANARTRPTATATLPAFEQSP